MEKVQNLEYQLSNGNYIACEERSQEFFDRCCKYNSNMTVEEVLQKLKQGKELRYDSDWHDNIRDRDVAKRKSETADLILSTRRPRYETVEEFDSRFDEK